MTQEKIIQWFLERRDQLPQMNLGLIGGLGAGKTHFVRNLLAALAPGFEAQVSSPSFNLCNRYQDGEFEIRHFDLYRLESIEELEEIEFYESLDEEAFTLVEWADQFDGIIEDLNMILEIKVDLEGERDYLITKLDEMVFSY